VNLYSFHKSPAFSTLILFAGIVVTVWENSHE
jgi:hypothetical protein